MYSTVNTSKKAMTNKQKKEKMKSSWTRTNDLLRNASLELKIKA